MKKLCRNRYMKGMFNTIGSGCCRICCWFEPSISLVREPPGGRGQGGGTLFPATESVSLSTRLRLSLRVGSHIEACRTFLPFFLDREMDVRKAEERLRASSSDSNQNMTAMPNEDDLTASPNSPPSFNLENTSSINLPSAEPPNAVLDPADHGLRKNATAIHEGLLVLFHILGELSDEVF